MWVLIFITSISNSHNSGVTSVVQEFSSKENCTVAQDYLIKQANSRDNFVLNNICAKK